MSIHHHPAGLRTMTVFPFLQSESRNAPRTLPRNLGRRRLLGALLAGTGLALVGRSPAAWPAPGGLVPLAERPTAPALRLADLQGQIVDLARMRGRVVLINFWATWCPPCRKEFPSLGRVRALFTPETFEVLAVNVEEEAETVKAFAGTAAFPVLLDAESRVVMSWPVKGLPTSFLVDRQGRLAYRLTGEQEFDDPSIVQAIRRLQASD